MGYREGTVVIRFWGRNSSDQVSLFGYIVFTVCFDEVRLVRITHGYVVYVQIYLKYDNDNNRYYLLSNTNILIFLI